MSLTMTYNVIREIYLRKFKNWYYDKLLNYVITNLLIIFDKITSP